MGLRKEVKRLATSNLRGYEKALASGKHEDVVEFFGKSGTKASDFSSEVIHKNLTDKHAVAILVEKAKDEVIAGDMTSFTEMVKQYFADDKKDKGIPFAAIKAAYSQDDATVGCQNAKIIYADAMTNWSVRTNGYSGQGHYNNVNTVVGLYKDAILNSVISDHKEEAKTAFEKFRQNDFTKFVISYKYGGDKNAFYAEMAGSNLLSDDKDKQKFGGFVVEQLTPEAKSEFVDKFGYSAKRLSGAVSPETQADLLDIYAGRETGPYYAEKNVVDILIDALKTENGIVTPIQTKASELVEKQGICFEDLREVRKAEIEEIRKGNSLAGGKHLKDYSSFCNLIYQQQNDDTVMDLAVKLSFDDSGNETPAKPYVVNILLNEVERVAKIKDKRIDVAKDKTWSDASDAVEAVVSTGSREDIETLKTLYELQIKRHENNNEYVKNRYGSNRIENEMKNENRLLCGVREVLAETKQKIAEFKI